MVQQQSSYLSMSVTGVYGLITQSAVQSCNVSFSKQISADELLNVLSGRSEIGPWASHVETFFNELPERYITGVAEENSLTLEQLNRIFIKLPSAFQGQNFKRLIRCNYE